MPSCRSCGAPMEWALTLAGKRIPLDPEPSPERGNIVLVDGSGDQRLALPLERLDEKARAAARRAGVPLRLSHFATCPNAKQHRRKRAA